MQLGCSGKIDCSDPSNWPSMKYQTIENYRAYSSTKEKGVSVATLHDMTLVSVKQTERHIIGCMIDCCYCTHQLHYQPVNASQPQAWYSQDQTCLAKQLAAGRPPRSPP